MRGRTITESDVANFAALTGDWHPQHTDKRWAETSPFGERIAHGMLVLSYAVGLVDFDPEKVAALRGVNDVVFKRPVKIGDTISVKAKEIKVDEARGLASYEWRVINQNDQLVVRAVIDVVLRTGATTAATSTPAESNGTPRSVAHPVDALLSGTPVLI